MSKFSPYADTNFEYKTSLEELIETKTILNEHASEFD